MLGCGNDSILKPYPISIINGQAILSGAAMERQLQLGHSAWFVPTPNFYLFGGLTETLPDGKSGSYYWLLYTKDVNASNPDHWLRKASQEEKYEYATKTIAAMDPKFQELIKISGPKGVGDNFMLFHDAIIESLPVGRITLLGDAAHPMTPCKCTIPYWGLWFYPQGPLIRTICGDG